MPIAAAVLPFAFLCLRLATAAPQPVEPSYQGKALSEWLLELNRKLTPEEMSPEELPAPDKAYERKRTRDEAAIRQIGTNALPPLLAMLSATRENLKTTLASLKSKELHEDVWSDPDQVEDVRKLALDGFEVLGTNAQAAVPQLTSLLHHSEALFEAAEALAKVGPRGFSALTNALADANGSVRGAALWALHHASPEYAQQVQSLLLGQLNDPNPVNQHNAAQFLEGHDASAIPALMKMLEDDKDYLAVSGAADGLRKLGPAAKSAAPRLLAIFTNSVVSPDRHDAETWGCGLLEALKAIDKETAAQAESFLINSGPLNYARNGYTLTKLTNGKELIAGGYLHAEATVLSNGLLASAQLNDPKGRWVETGPLNVARHAHTATLLKDGRVLVAGGSDAKGAALASAELYEPANGTWTLTGSLNHARFYHTAGLQPDGKVMVEGGHSGREALRDIELYDPASGQWSMGPAAASLLPAARACHSATVLLNGKVLIAGGLSAATAELFDPATGAWTNTAAPASASTATLLHSGKVLVTGAAARAQVYDPATGAWADTSPMTVQRELCTATLLSNGKVLVAGGQGNREQGLASAEEFEPATAQWTKTGELAQARFSHVAALLPNGKVLVAGGKDSTFNVLVSAELYDPVTRKWASTGPMDLPRWRHTATLLPNGKVLVAGGSTSVEATSSAELYDPASGKWTQTGQLRVARYDHTATLLPNGNVLVTGSSQNSGGAPSSAEVYDRVTGKWLPTQSLSAERSGHTATLLPDGTVLIVGGGTVNRMELYAPSIRN